MEDKIYIRSYASELLNIADQDYISARCLFRADVWESYLMVAQQCIEKYLKVILLYNLISVKSIAGNGHNLEKLLNEVCKLKPINSFISQLKKEKGEKYYNNVAKGIDAFNYFEHTKYGVLPFSYQATSLIILDDFVFIFRRFCQNPGNYPMLKEIKRYKFSSNRYLEKVIKNKDGKYDRQYCYLIWKNFHWGRRKKKGFRLSHFYRSKNPIFFSTNPKESYKALKDQIIIPRELANYFESL